MSEISLVFFRGIELDILVPKLSSGNFTYFQSWSDEAPREATHRLSSFLVQDIRIGVVVYLGDTLRYL